MNSNISIGDMKNGDVSDKLLYRFVKLFLLLKAITPLENLYQKVHAMVKINSK